MALSVRGRVKKAAANEDPIGPDPLLPDLGAELELHKQAFEVERLRGELSRAQSLHVLREEYSGRVYRLVSWWLFGVFLAVMLAGFRLWSFSLSDSVLIAFITSTTLNVIGLFVVVAKWLFPPPDPPNTSHRGMQPKTANANSEPKPKSQR